MQRPDPAPLKLLTFCTQFEVGGITRHAVELGDWLRGRGHDVAFAGTPGAWLNPETDPSFLALDSRGVADEDGEASLFRRLSSVRACAARLRAWLRSHPVDLIHAHETAPALIARLATLGRDIPIVLTFHGAEPERMRQFAITANVTATHVISTYQRGAEDLARLGLRAGKITTIGVGVRPLGQVDGDRVAQVRRDLLGPEGRFLVVTVARLCRQKALDTFIDVAARVGAARPDLRFVIVGDGPLEEPLRAQADALGASEIVRFAGRSDEPQLYLRAADLFLLTSLWEARPYTISEAFQAGLPAVGTDCGGVTELIDSTVGAMTAIGDVDGLARAVLEIAQDPALHARMSAAAVSRSQEDRFRHDFVHQRIEALYHDVLARQRDAARSSRRKTRTPPSPSVPGK